MLSAFAETLGCRPRANLLTHTFIEQAFWQPFARTVNERRRALGMAPIGHEGIYRHLLAEEHPCLFGYSAALVPTPRDWSPWHHVTGYWFLDLVDDYEPPPGLAEFLEDGPPPVFIGFGSMVAGDDERAKRTRAVIAAVEQAGQRAVLECSGGAIGGVDLPGTMHYISNVPYEWLWPRMAAVAHHGGAGSTAAGLRFGRPTIVCPFLGDQFFWAQRVARLGAGPQPVPIKKLTARRFADALAAATTDAGIRARAAGIGAQIQAEDGVATAVELFEQYAQRGFPARPAEGIAARVHAHA
jgi:UDP:flavonoid glycosyltransferase YjiC (YdhE family)